MSDAATTIILPQDQRTIAGHEGARINRLGPALQQRPPDTPAFANDESGPEIVLDTGDVQVSVEEDDDIGAPAVHGTGTQNDNPNFGENLALDDHIDLAGIANEITEGVEADMSSRLGWTQQYQEGLEFLATKIDKASQNASNEKGISRVGHPLMIEAMIKYWASAQGELLPAAGPAKVPTIGKVPESEELLAQDFEDDINYFLTEVAKEYYPDTASMLMQQAYCGVGYKKCYRNPIKRRPASESVMAPDLIVSEEATDLDTAQRVTHSIQMIKGQLQRMQLVGQYRACNLGQPQGDYGIGRTAQRALDQLAGITPSGLRPQDKPYEIWECDTELDIGHFSIDGKYERGAPDGIALPYKVAMERHSREVLGVWRNWHPDDELYLKRNMFVKFGLIPGLTGGFHSWGFLQLLGNQTSALRSCWRLLIDAGMFSNFPGGLKAKGRTSTNEISPAPGEWVDIDLPTGPNFDIRKYLMALPYNPPNPVFVQLAEIIKQDAMRLAGTAMLEVGEGRTNVPVGTVLAMVEQQMQVMAAVHKQNHVAQKEELRKLRELFAENPEDLSMLCRLRPRDPNREARVWRLAEEFSDLNLMPATDPNVPGRVHQLLMANVMMMIAQQAGVASKLDIDAILKNIFQTIGKDPDTYVLRPDQQQQNAPPPDPRVVAKQIDATTKQMEAQSQGQIAHEKIGLEREKMGLEGTAVAAENETKRNIAQTKQAGDFAKANQSAAHQAVQSDRAAAHQAAQGARDAVQEHALADRQAGHDHALMDRQAGHDLVQVHHEAALKPPPEPSIP